MGENVRYADNFCSYEEKFEPHRYVFTGKCVITGKTHSVEVPAEELYKYRQGAKIQDAMKSVSVHDREFLMTGYSEEGWNQIFGE